MIPILLVSLLLTISTPKVTELDPSLFEQETSSHHLLFLYFYSPDCKYCHILQPEFKKLSQNAFDYDIVFGRVDATKHTKLSAKYNVSQYPTIMLIDRGSVINFAQSRKAQDMHKWLNKYSTRRIKNVTFEQSLTLRRPFVSLSRNASEEIYHLLNSAIFQVHGLKAFIINQSQQNQPIVMNLRDGSTVSYYGVYQKQYLTDWLKDNSKSIIMYVDNQQLAKKMILQQRNPVMIVVFGPHDHENDTFHQFVLSFCGLMVGQVTCMEILPHFQTYHGVHAYFQVHNRESSFFGLVVEKMEVGWKLEINPKTITVQEIQNWIGKAIQGKEPKVVDNNIPDRAKFTKVTVLKDLQEFNKTISQNKFVLVTFHHQHDNASLFFSKIYEKFAGFNKLLQIKVTALDCTGIQKQCKELKVHHYPQVVLYVRGVPIHYEKTPKLPSISDLNAYLSNKIQTNLFKLNGTQYLPKEQFSVVVHTNKLTPLLRAMPSIVQPVKSYFKNDSTETKIDIRYGDQIVNTYSGEMHSNLIRKWVKDITSALLHDVLTEKQAKPIAQAVKNKKPIILFLDVDLHLSAKYRLLLGTILKELGIVGGYAESTHQTFDSLVQWIGIQTPTEPKVIYADTANDKRYVFPRQHFKISKSAIKEFIQNVKAGKVKPSGEQEQEQKQVQSKSEVNLDFDL